MSVTTGPNLGLMINALTGDSFPVDFRKLLRALDVLIEGAVINRTNPTPPGSPANGDRYIVAGSPTGAWTGHAGSIAVWTTDNPGTPGGLWEFYAPKEGFLVWSTTDASLYVYTAGAWTAAGGGGGGGGMSNPMTTLGDLITGGSSGTPGRLAIGSSGQILKVVSGAPAWSTPSGGGTLAGDSDVSLTSPANNDVLTYESSSSLWKNKPPSGGGGGAIAASTNVALLPGFTGTNNYAGYTVFAKLGSRSLVLNPTTWKFSTKPTGGILDGAVVYRTLRDSLTIVDATTVLYSGSPTINPMAAGELFSDTIALPIDMTHDYYIAMYFDPGAAASHANWSSAIQIFGTYAFTLVTGGYVSGNQTTLTTGGTIPTLSTVECILSQVIALS